MAKQGGIYRKGEFRLAGAEKRHLRGYRKNVEEIAEDSLNHFLEGFRKGGGQTDASRGGWK